MRTNVTVLPAGLLTTGLTVLAWMLAGCTLFATATVSMEVERRDATLLVRGSTDLPDGAILYVGLSDPDGTRIESVPTVVENGSYMRDLDLMDWPPGRVLVLVGFSIEPDQPDAVVDRFGPDGERLAGPNVHVDSDGQRELQLYRAITID